MTAFGSDNGGVGDSGGCGRVQPSTEVDTGPPVLDGSVGLDEAPTGVVGDVLGHHFAGVEAEFVEPGSERFLLSEFEEASAEACALLVRIDSDVVDVEVVFDPPHDDQALDVLVSDRDEDALLSDQRFVVGQHRRRNERRTVQVDRIGSVDKTLHFTAVGRRGTSDHLSMLRTARR